MILCTELLYISPETCKIPIVSTSRPPTLYSYLLTYMVMLCTSLVKASDCVSLDVLSVTWLYSHGHTTWLLATQYHRHKPLTVLLNP